MPTIMICHDVKDTKHWLASPIRKQVLEPIGVTNIRTFTDPQNSTASVWSWTSQTWKS
ncbi:hypothetical protein FHT79_003663 [Rhizobium sp. BK212]|nr:hypothetical protein [Rhizobium sp. BK212]